MCWDFGFSKFDFSKWNENLIDDLCFFITEGFELGCYPSTYSKGTFCLDFFFLIRNFFVCVCMCIKSDLTEYLFSQACADSVRLEVCAGWLRGPMLGERLVDLARELCAVGLRGPPSSSSSSSPLSSHHAHGWPLISLALSQQHNNGEAYISFFQVTIKTVLFT